MRVAFFGYFFPFLSAGTSRLDDFTRILLKRGVKTSILSPITIRKRAKLIEVHKGIYILRFPALSSRKVPVIGTLFSIVNSFTGCCMLNFLRKTDVVVFSIPPGETALGAIMACNLMNKPFVIDVRDPWEDFKISTERGLSRLWYIILKKLYNKIYNDALFTTAVTQTVRSSLLRRGIKKVHLLPHGIDTKIFAPRSKIETRLQLGLNPKDFIIIYAGVLQNYYRIDIPIKAVHKLISEKLIEDIGLLVIGWGPKLGEYAKLAKTLKLTKNVLFLGSKPRQEIAEYLSCSDVGVIPLHCSMHQALTLKFHEYCSSRLPIIASVPKGAPLANQIEKWKVGLIVEPLNVEEMSQAIEFLYHNYGKRRDMGNNARLYILNFRELEKITSRMWMLLSKYLGT